jgi:hypothetical protein
MLAALFAGAVYLFCIRRTMLADPDIWWHLKNAEHLFQSHSFVRQDLYTYSVHGRAWIDPEWLSEAFYYLAWKFFGYRGLECVAILMVEAMAFGVVALSWQVCGRMRPALLAGVAYMLFATVSIGPRTQMFGWLCLIAEIAVLRAFVNGRARLWLLPPLFCLWINVHGSWPIGLVFLALLVISGWREFERGLISARAWTVAQRKQLIAVGLLCVMALFLNPYGWRLVSYPFAIATQHQVTLGAVQEWQTLDFHSFRGRAVFAMIAGLLFAGAWKSRRWELYDALTLLVAVLAMFSYSRFLLLGGIVICPLLSREFPQFGEDAESRDKRWLNTAVTALVGLFIVSHLPSQQKLHEEADAGYPAGAVAYLRAHPIEGPLLNDFNWGGYLIWNLPLEPVYIDSRADVFDESTVFAQYMDVVGLKRRVEDLDGGRVEGVLFPGKEPLVGVLRQSGRWVVAYEDSVAVLMVRR